MLKQKTVYFREEDLPLWAAVEKKAEWLHEKLNPTIPPPYKVGHGIAKTPTKNPTYRINATKGTAVATQIIKTKDDIPDAFKGKKEDKFPPSAASML